MEFGIGDIVTSKSDLYWLHRYEVVITDIKDGRIAYDVIRNIIPDKNNQYERCYNPYTFLVSNLKLIRKGNKNRRIIK